MKIINKYPTLIEDFWQKREKIAKNTKEIANLRKILFEIIDLLNLGKVRVCERINSSNQWTTNEWVKKSILLYFKFMDSKSYVTKYAKWLDKVPGKFASVANTEFNNLPSRIVPGSFIRTGSYIGKNTIIMPSFINIGAYIGDGTMIDTWSTVGSCAQIGKNCHISGGVGIGGVLEPIQSQPVIIEDNCFIGARSEVAEGVIIEEGAVLGMGVFIGLSTKIVDRYTGEIIYGKVPRYSVVVPGSMPSTNNKLPSLYCAVIIKKVDEKTRSKVQINELLRYS